MHSENQDMNRNRRRFVTVERGLLFVILVFQVVIAWGLFLRGGEGALSKDQNSCSVGAGDCVDSNAKSPARRNVHPTLVSPRDLFADMDAYMADAVDNMARIRSVMHMDEGWEAIPASPTMDMRNSDQDYLVSFNIPGARSSDIKVSLDGRVLTVCALAPSQTPHSRQLQQFEQRILLPGSVGGAEGASASITNGVLTVRIPKGDSEDALPGSFRIF